jgi:hypothetical protein
VSIRGWVFSATVGAVIAGAFAVHNYENNPACAVPLPDCPGGCGFPECPGPDVHWVTVLLLGLAVTAIGALFLWISQRAKAQSGRG